MFEELSEGLEVSSGDWTQILAKNYIFKTEDNVPACKL